MLVVNVGVGVTVGLGEGEGVAVGAGWHRSPPASRAPVQTGVPFQSGRIPFSGPGTAIVATVVGCPTGAPLVATRCTYKPAPLGGNVVPDPTIGCPPKATATPSGSQLGSVYQPSASGVGSDPIPFVTPIRRRPGVGA